MPERYTLRTSEGEKLISCRESPNILASIQRGLSIAAGAAARHSPGTIFLDGVVDGAPFIDAEKHIYNLDHHSECVRLFTLSTCEQAYVLIRSGLDLPDREWKIIANEADLDTVLAIWLLMNHARLNSPDEELRRELVPLVRLEGVIDVHGFQMLEFAGLPGRELEQARERLSGLLERETELKKKELWSQTDFADYTLGLLHEIDRIVYSPGHFEGFEVVDELAKVTLEDNHVAVVVRSEVGIYETERQLRRVYEKRLGIIALMQADSRCTLRQVKPFLSTDLSAVYSVLNRMDPAVAGNNRWGGSDLIGGSPRRSGTRLGPADIIWAVERAFARSGAAQVLLQLAVGAAVVAASLFGAWTLSVWAGGDSRLFIAGLFACALVLLVISSQPYPRLYGLRLPVGKSWILFLAGSLPGGLLGGAWIPTGLSGDSFWLTPWLSLLLVLVLPGAAELLFRGSIHGLLAERLPTQSSAGSGFLSWPVVFSAALYAAVSGLSVVPAEFFIVLRPTLIPELGDPAGRMVGVAGAILFGLATGMARERSESLLAPLVLHWLTAGMLVLSYSGLPI